jgi:hypothetical protein
MDLIGLMREEARRLEAAKAEAAAAETAAAAGADQPEDGEVAAEADPAASEPGPGADQQ